MAKSKKAAAATLSPSSGVICLRGQLTKEGVECQAFRSTDNTLYTLVGQLGSFRAGDEVVVCGTIVSVSFCMQGQTIAVTSISRPHSFTDSETRERDIEVTVTRSTADNSPSFKLEGKPMVLRADGKSWVGTYADVSIEDPLQIFFQSGGWKNQEFTLVVVVKHPSQPGKDKKGEFRRNTSKGEVTFDETMELA